MNLANKLRSQKALLSIAVIATPKISAYKELNFLSDC